MSSNHDHAHDHDHDNDEHSADVHSGTAKDDVSAPGRYELVCNLKNHYANGMHHELDVR